MTALVLVDGATAAALAPELAAWLRAHPHADPDVRVTVVRLLLVSRSGQSLATHGPPPHIDHVSTAQAAAALNVSRRTITRWIADGTLPATRIGGRFAVALDDLTAPYGATVAERSADGAHTPAPAARPGAAVDRAGTAAPTDLSRPERTA